MFKHPMNNKEICIQAKLPDHMDKVGKILGLDPCLPRITHLYKNGTVKLIIFDLDGTLVNSQEFVVDAITVAFQSEGLIVPPVENILTIIGLSLIEAFKKLDKNLTEIRDQKLGKGILKNCYKTLVEKKFYLLCTLVQENF